LDLLLHKRYGAVHKSRPHKISENRLPPPYLKNVRIGSTPFVRADTPKISKNLKFFAPKSADVRI